MITEDDLNRIHTATRVLVLLADQNEEDVNAFRQLAGLGDGVARHDDLLALAAGDLNHMVCQLLERFEQVAAT